MSNALTLYNLPGDIYDHLSEFLDNKSLFVLLMLSPRHITVSKYLLQQRKWRQKSMEHWAEVGDLKAVQYLHRRFKCEPLYLETMRRALENAAENGHLEVVKFLRGTGAAAFHALSLYEYHKHPTDVCCGNGHLEVVKFLHSVGTVFREQALSEAAANGHLEMVKFLHGIGVVGNKYVTWTMYWATQNGHLEVVQFLQSIGYNTDHMEAKMQLLHGIGRSKSICKIDFFLNNDLKNKPKPKNGCRN